MTFEPTGVRRPAVAGSFYPGGAAELRSAVEGYLRQARGSEERPETLKALIAPHAGYVYSGAVAGSAFSRLRPRRAQISKVVLLGPSHFEPIRGLALPDVTEMQTPLGSLPIDHELARAVLEMPQVAVSPEAHAREHCLEVELPFLQVALGELSVLPLVVGHATAEQVAEVLERIWGGPDTVIVVSSDLSHYLPWAAAREIDRETADSIVALSGPLPHQRACGAVPINGLLVVAARKGLIAERIDLRNSGDTAGDRDRVVGYGAFAFHEG